MLKIVVYDSGRGGELFVTYLKRELPLVEVIPIIDREYSKELRCNRIRARRIAKDAISPFIGKVDLIVFANHFLTATSLKYFKHRYPEQKFVGFNLPLPDTFVSRPTLVLTTSALGRRPVFRKYIHSLKRNMKIIYSDQLIPKIDEGSLSFYDVRKNIVQRANMQPKELILTCSHFSEIKGQLRLAYGRNLKIYDSYSETCHEIYRTLKIRGYYKKRK